jgi:hypothetical protein
VRERLVSQRTGVTNQIRAFLLDRGIAVRQGLRQLERLALHYGYTVTKMIEKLATDAERALLSRLPSQKQTVYLDGHRQRTASHKAPTRYNPRLSKKARSRLRRKVKV